MSPASTTDQLWISRCFDLARRGIGHVSPNPPVGAVLVFQNRILGEGFHTRFGGPHAEVEAFRNVTEAERHLIPEATLYVSLEPCCITGKTPPCTALILREGVKDVRIAVLDPNPDIAGRGVEWLRLKGVQVITQIMEKEGLELIRSFSKNILHHKPYVMLKWAQSKFGFIGLPDEKIWLSHPYTSFWMHKKRSMVDAIMVGSRTIILDDPQLTTRDYEGRSPHRVIYDPNGKLTDRYRVFQNDARIVFYFSTSENQNITGTHVRKCQLHVDSLHTDQILHQLYLANIGILLVEGGAFMHHLFIENNAWDEALVIQTTHELNSGIKAPLVKGKLLETSTIGVDQMITILKE